MWTQFFQVLGFNLCTSAVPMAAMMYLAIRFAIQHTFDAQRKREQTEPRRIKAVNE